MYRRHGRPLIELDCPIYGTTFNDLDQEWMREWGTNFELPAGATELTRVHINTYEVQSDRDSDGDSDSVVADNHYDSHDNSANDFSGSESGDEQPARHSRHNAAMAEQLLPGEGNAIEPEAFRQGLQGRGWLNGAAGLTPGGIVLLLVRQMLMHVVTCTRAKNAQENMGLRDLSLGELLCFHALRIMMNIQKLSSADMYWMQGTSGPITFPNFGRWMTLRRFKEIKRMLRFEMYDDDEDHPDDNAWKIRTITELTRTSFATVVVYCTVV